MRPLGSCRGSDVDGSPVALNRLGYACIALDCPATSSRGTILRRATPERLLDLTASNLDGLRGLLEYTISIGVRLFRMSSDIVPFGSHPVNTTRWWEVFASELGDLGELIRQHRLRVSLHPGQYTLLSAPDPRVLASSIADLEFHARLLDAMGLDRSHKIITHGGGLYGNRTAALTRWVEAHHGLQEAVRARLVLENDERLYGANDVLELSARSGVPVCFDVFHHRVMRDRDAARQSDGTLRPATADEPDLRGYLRAAFATWDLVVDGIPKIHLSSQAPGRRAGAHAEYVDPTDLDSVVASAPPAPDFDCMLEAKAKDRALLRLRADRPGIEAAVGGGDAGQDR